MYHASHGVDCWTVHGRQRSRQLARGKTGTARARTARYATTVLQNAMTYLWSSGDIRDTSPFFSCQSQLVTGPIPTAPASVTTLFTLPPLTAQNCLRLEGKHSANFNLSISGPFSSKQALSKSSKKKLRNRNYLINAAMCFASMLL